MTELKTPVTYTANRLLDGVAVWLGRNGVWVDNIEFAAAAHTLAEQEQFRAMAEQADAENLVVEPYEIDVAVQGSLVTPTKFRERIRAAGPTNRLDLGKQAERAAQAA